MVFDTKDITEVTLLNIGMRKPVDGDYVGTYGGYTAVFSDASGAEWSVTTANGVKGFGYHCLVRVADGKVIKMVTL